MLKRFFVLIAIVMFMFSFAGMSFAGHHSIGASYNAGAQAVGGAIDGDLSFTPWYQGGNGIAGGFSAAGGTGSAEATGGVLIGSVGGSVSATGGGLVDSDASHDFVIDVDGHKVWKHHHKVFVIDSITFTESIGSASQAEGITEADAAVNVSGFLGASAGHIEGIAGEITLDGSAMALPWYSYSDGFTGGIAGQGAIGGFEGNTISGTFIGDAESEVGASIDMYGGSLSESKRWVTFSDGSVTEGLRTDVAAATYVESSKIETSSGNCIAGAYADVDGGWAAKGGAATLTVQSNPYGSANAYASGSYQGSGNLGTNYQGSATGYSQTTNTTVNGLKGSINTAAAGMQVTSTYNNN